MRKKNKLIIFVLILFISVGFAYLSTTPKINGSSLIKGGKWSVYLENIDNEYSSYKISSPATITIDKKAIEFGFTFASPGDEYYFYVDVKNAGTLDAMLESYEVTGLTEEQAKYLEWTVTYADETELKKYDLLKKSSYDTLRILVKFKEDITKEDLPSTSDSIISLKFLINYVQSEKSVATERTKTPYTITYNLDGGEISNNPTTYYQGDRVEIPNPTKEGYTFTGWTVGKNLFRNHPDQNNNNGISITTDSNGMISYYGTLTQKDGWFNLGYHANDRQLTPGTYTYSTKDIKDYSLNIKGYLSEDNSIYEERITKGTKSVTFTITSNYRYYTFVHFYSNKVGYIEDKLELQVELGNKATNYEPYIHIPTKDIVIPKGYAGNRYYVANWTAN